MSRSLSQNVASSQSTSKMNSLMTSTSNSNKTQRGFGVEVTSDLVWKHWDVGGDHAKKIIVKNVSTEVVEVKYELPKSKNFFMGFPEPSKISPGVSVAFEIRFRPTERKNYCDTVKLTVLKKGELTVNISALLPKALLDVPNCVDMGFCPTMETTRKEFEMVNVGEASFEFSWSVKTPFAFKPSYGRLNVGEALTVHVFFSPKDASSFVSTAICKLSSGDAVSMQLQGVGKITHIIANETNISFGKSPIESPSKRVISLKNTSLVPASFSINKVENDYVEDVFSFDPKSQILPPGSTSNITITYIPSTIDCFDCNNYTISTPGGNTIRLTCSGYGVGPELIISPMSINFGDVFEGKEVKRLITLENKSNMSAEYNFKVDTEGTFKFERNSGVVPAFQTRQITVTFIPHLPINYYRRIFIVVKNQGVTFIDLLGTGYNDSRRPPPFSIKEVYLFKERMYKGLPAFSPSEIENYLELSESGRLDTLSAEERENISNLTQVLSNTTSTTDLIRDNIENTLNEFFNLVTDYDNPISINYSSISFGSCSRFKLAEYKTVTISNRTNGKITCDVQIPSYEGSPSPFVIFPETVDIKPMSTFTFKIGFRPSYDNQFFSNEIEFICYFKSNRSFRLVNSQTFVPPWILPLKVFGNTFNNTAAFIPRFTLQPSHVTSFPPCLTNDSTYRSYTIYNENDIPMPFEFLITTEQRRYFTCYPENGLVPSNSFQIIVFKFSPTEPGSYQDSIKCIFNDSPNHTVTIPIFGMSFLPSISFGKDGKLFFKPTLIGASSVKELTLHNPSRIPITYEWDIPKDFSSVFSVSKKTGILNGNETQKIIWTFTPSLKKVYSIKIPCIVSSVAEINRESVKTRSYLILLGEGNNAGITVEPSNIDFGNVLVNEKATQTLTLLNSSDCDLPFELIIRENINGEQLPSNSGVLECETMKGIVASRSHKHVQVFYRPNQRKLDQFTIFCSLNLNREASAMTEEQILSLQRCDVFGIGSYPQLGITDIRSASGSKVDLWSQFSVNSINKELRKNTNCYQIESSITNFNSSIQYLEKYFCDFGAKPIESEDTIVYVTIENIGNIRAQFSISTPFDSMVDVDKWAHDQVAKDEDELRTLSIFVNKLFEIYPNQASLEPGESIVVALIYRHKVVDTHEIPILFQIRNGRCFTIYLTGRTLSYQQKHLQFGSMEHTLEDQEIGTENQPIQYLKVINPTNQDIEICVDEQPFKQLALENYDFEIISLENKKSIVPANHYIYLRLVFRPIELKTYEMCLPIQMMNSDLVYNLTLKGKGVEKICEPLEYDEEAQIVKHVPTEVQKVQQQKTPTQTVAFSMDVIDFESIPFLSVHTRIVSISNLSSDILSFSWNTVLPLDDNQLSSTVKIEPLTSTLQPQETKCCKITLSAGSVSQLLNCDIYCEVSNISKKERKEQRKKKYEETLVHYAKDDDISDQVSEKSILSIKEHFANPKNRLNKGRIVPKAVTKNTTKRESVISKSTIARDNALTLSAYSTAIPRYLPVSKTITKQPVLERPSSASVDKFGLQPVLPTKHYLTIKCKVIPLEEFKYGTRTREKWQEEFIPQLYEFTPDHRPTSSLSVTSSIDRNMFSDILSGMLQEIMHDNDLEQSLVETNNWEASSVFYCEIAETPRSTSSRPSSALPKTESKLASQPATLSSFTEASVNFHDLTPPTSECSVKSTKEIREEEKLVQEHIVQDPKFQKALEWILDETLFKIVSEISGPVGQ
ncbi:hypothetical protein C9374_012554 [Naegleria lovaniensis]|uniref:Abnormal spindle-like microcephaly-associated protein ASH domain-containing protein n=1 Tax=Naegleria lovaniensis TaxID=51637 RepID=A0AA88KQF9_NAELO|nr:uncharacterized protein C9374_012554 [Naegleria lovaniensis]KAG2392302.1 hypothetical protein C9374_012554 [Naegleria lovaniensis]